MTDPDDTYAALHRETGGKLFTVTVLDRDAGLARRVYSSDPKTYPISGTKPMSQGDWTTQVIDRGEIFVANTVDEFAPYFADRDLIETLGCASALNVPVRTGDGMVTGTVNVLDVEHHFTAARVDEIVAAVDAANADLLAAMERADLT